jgi:hypothetical protein
MHRICRARCRAFGRLRVAWRGFGWLGSSAASPQRTSEKLCDLDTPHVASSSTAPGSAGGYVRHVSSRTPGRAGGCRPYASLVRSRKKAAARRSDCHWQRVLAKSTGRPRGRGCFRVVTEFGRVPFCYYRRIADESTQNLRTSSSFNCRNPNRHPAAPTAWQSPQRPCPL